MPERNEAMTHRYYFHFAICGLRFSECLSELRKEFFLSENRIVKVLMDQDTALRNLIADHPGIKELELKYPHFNWKEIKRA